MRVTGYDTGGFYDEMFDAASAAAPRGAAAARHDRVARGRPARTLPAGRRAPPPPDRHHLQRLRRLGRHRADLPLRPDPAHRRGRGVGLDRARAQAAHPRAEPVHRRHLPRAEDPQGRGHPRGSRSARPRSTGRSASASTRRRASGATSPAPIWCATATARSTSSRTTCACPPASPTCSRTAT